LGIGKYSASQQHFNWIRIGSVVILSCEPEFHHSLPFRMESDERMALLFSHLMKAISELPYPYLPRLNDPDFCKLN